MRIDSSNSGRFSAPILPAAYLIDLDEITFDTPTHDLVMQFAKYAFEYLALKL